MALGHIGLISLNPLPILILLLALLALPLPGASAEESLQQVSLQLRWTHQFQFAGYYAALHKGFYRLRGLDVRILPSAPGESPINPVLKGQVQYGVANAELLRRYLKGDPLLALAAIFQHSPAALLTLADSGLVGPEDLRGKRVMMMGDGEDLDFLAMLSKAGMTADELSIRPSSFDLNDLIEGRVDALNIYSTNEPFQMQRRGIPFRLIEPARHGADFYSDFLFTSRQELRAHPERARAFREASLQGWQYAMRHKEEIIDLILREYLADKGQADKEQAGKTRAHLRFEAEAMERLILPELVPLGQINPARIEQMASLMGQLGLAKPGIDLEPFLYDPDPKVTRSLFFRSTLGIGLLLLIIGLVALTLWRFNRRLQREVAQRRQTEQQLQDSERHYRAIIENLQDVYFRTDIQGHIQEISPSVTRVFGHARADLQGRPMGPLFINDLPFNRFARMIKAADGHLHNLESCGRNAAGMPRWLSINCRSITQDGQLLGYEGTIRDITQRKLAEESLQQERNLAESIINTAQAIILVLDTQGSVVHLNPYTEQLTGYSLAEIKGRDWFATFLPEAEVQRVKRVFQMAMSDIDISGQVNPLLLRDGSRRLVEWYNKTLKDSSGEVIGVLAIGHDISERVKSEEKLKLAASVFTYAQEGIYITQPDGIIVDINEAFTQITGYRRDEAIGQHTRLLKSGRHNAEFYEDMWRQLLQQGSWAGEVWNRRKNGDLYPQLLTISAISNHRGEVSHYVALFTEISEQKAYQNQLEQIAHYDSLTQLPNRVLLADRLQQGMYQTARRDLQLAVVFLDLDGFKAVNDRHGHDVGDQLLIQLAERMRAALREGDTIGRLGGDEFVAVLIDIQRSEDSIPLLERLLQAAAEPVQIDDLVLQVSASIGVTFYPQDEEVDPDQLLRQADQAMYQAKVSGKNRYHLFDTETDRNTRGLHENLEAIRQALIHQEFLLYYQPKVNMRSGELVGAEALVRWDHPKRGILSPLNFLPLIENHPLSLELGHWVIDSALGQMERWAEQGLSLPVSVNVSGLQLQQSDFVEQLERQLQAHPGVPRGHLELEVVETSALEDIHQVSRIIHRCKALGVGFALDDFGTGYSSLTYLKRLPASRIKIDQTFVRDMLEDPDDLAILEGVLGMAKAFALDVVAEGVETREHGEMLLQLDCVMGQGYGIGHPMPAERLIGWSKTWRPFPEWTRQQPLPLRDMPLLQAGAEHRAWLRWVREYLLRERREAPPLLGERCRFGQWLRNEGDTRFAQVATYQEVKRLHDQLHERALAICALPPNQNQAQNQVQAHLAELEALLQAFLDQLRGLILLGQGRD
jgi:diguanylate cyclase (GGDEF)-like protein/PAS domain S-box-containing protein